MRHQGEGTRQREWGTTPALARSTCTTRFLARSAGFARPLGLEGVTAKPLRKMPFEPLRSSRPADDLRVPARLPRLNCPSTNTLATRSKGKFPHASPQSQTPRLLANLEHRIKIAVSTLVAHGSALRRVALCHIGKHCEARTLPTDPTPRPQLWSMSCGCCSKF